MAKPEHDDLADALARMAGGEIAPGEQEFPAPSEAPPPPPVKPAKPAAPAKPPLRAPAAPQAAKPPARSAAPASRPLPPVAKTPAPAAAPAPSSARPQRPTAPASRPAAPIVPNLAPPVAPPEDDTASQILPEDENPIVDDDDAVIVPAPDAAVFAPKAKARPIAHAPGSAIYQTIEFRRTVIPILLTCGLLLIIFAAMKFVLSSDSPLAELPGWLPPMLFITGAVMLGLGILNMLSVQSSLANIAGDVKRK